MADTANLSPTIVAALYSEALALTDRAREAFDLSGRMTAASEDEDLARVALSCAALRTTTRMMHAVAWLLNQRAYMAGELSELQMHRHGRLPPLQPDPESAQTALLSAELGELIEQTKRFCTRIQRLDEAWHGEFAGNPAPVHHLQDRLEKAVGAL